MHIPQYLIIVIAIVLASCTGGGGNVPVPRRTAYPRVPHYDAQYTSIDSLPLYILANRDASTDVDRKNDGTYWLTVEYPEYRAKIYCTFTPVDVSGVQRVIDNRTERIRLNAGDRTPNTEEVAGRHGFSGALVETATVSATPLQFITVDTRDAKWVVTGTAFIDGITPDTKADSIAPVIATLRRDIKMMLDSIG